MTTGPSFFREHARLMRAGTPADHAERVAEAFVAVRDAWIAQGRHRDLVRAILANWTSGNGVAFMTPLSVALVAAGERDLHAHLWARTIRRQLDTFFHALGQCAPRPAFLRLLNLDTTGFVETDPAARRRPERAAAFLLQRLVADLQQWRDELRGAGWPDDAPVRVLDRLRALERPRLTVPRLPAASP